MSVVDKINVLINETEDNVKNFDKALASFLKGYQEIVDKEYSRNSMGRKLEVKKDKKYYKIIAKDMVDGNVVTMSGSAWAFINSENGDVLKPAGWNAPAKHASGNIFDENNGLKSMSVYGPAYLR